MFLILSRHKPLSLTYVTPNLNISYIQTNSTGKIYYWILMNMIDKSFWNLVTPTIIIFNVGEIGMSKYWPSPEINVWNIFRWHSLTFSVSYQYLLYWDNQKYFYYRSYQLHIKNTHPWYRQTPKITIFEVLDFAHQQSISLT